MKILILSILVAIVVAKASYDGYKVIRLNLKTKEEAKFVFELSEKYMADVWKGPSTVIPTDIMLSPSIYEDFTSELAKSGLTYKVIIENVQKKVDQSFVDNIVEQFSTLQNVDGPNVSNKFLKYDEINDWIDSLQSRSTIVSSGSYGKTYQGRDIKYIKISTGPGKKTVLMNGGIHAREWLAVSTIVYMVDKMVNLHGSGDSEITRLLDQYDFYFVPVVNPDGYEFTHSSQRARLWRKNLRPMRTYFGQICYGVDLNRNFDANFGGAGTSNNKCADTYRGPSAFSEPETAAFSRFARSISNNMKLFIGLHSYSQFWFVPWAYTSARPADDAEMRRVANIGSRALYEVNKVKFVVGNPPELLYAAAGGTYDWIKMTLGVKYTYTLELRPQWGSSNDGSGFIAPVSDIKPSGEEVFAGLIATVKAIRV